MVCAFAPLSLFLIGAYIGSKGLVRLVLTRLLVVLFWLGCQWYFYCLLVFLGIWLVHFAFLGIQLFCRSLQYLLFGLLLIWHRLVRLVCLLSRFLGLLRQSKLSLGLWRVFLAWFCVCPWLLLRGRCRRCCRLLFVVSCLHRL
jgi:hypothetical protein